MRPFSGFVVVGAVGFVVHTLGVTTLMADYDANPIAAWALAFALAVSLTWFLNRMFVFRLAPPHRTRTPIEYTRYVLVQAGGAVLSLLIFSALLHAYPSLRETPVAAVAAGAGVALLFNYAGAKRWVFAIPDGDQAVADEQITGMRPHFEPRQACHGLRRNRTDHEARVRRGPRAPDDS